VGEFLDVRDEAFYQEAVDMLKERWNKCNEDHGGYVEKIK